MDHSNRTDRAYSGRPAVITAALVVNLRFLGLGARELTMGSVTSRYLPWLWWSLPVLFATV